MLQVGVCNPSVGQLARILNQFPSNIVTLFTTQYEPRQNLHLIHHPSLERAVGFRALPPSRPYKVTT